ncbi:MAG: MerC family mercury resistance protein [Alphaproteobacteria bacterium]|nr:MerC family mercury resistance protein [Alphaproteobacteria bacterium]
MKKPVKTFPSILAAGAAALPILKCPFCWPLYAGLLSSLGISFVNYTRYLLPITSILLLCALASIGWRARQRRGYRPFILALIASIQILLGKFYFSWPWMFYIAAVLLVTASVWNIWPQKNACFSCGDQRETLNSPKI